jgi:hypothetical protein
MAAGAVRAWSAATRGHRRRCVCRARMGDMILSSYNFWVRLAVQFTCICMVLIKRTRNEGFDAELPGTISTSE